jgi:multicomponent Na+:H+ antiporter subunit F
MGGPYTFNEVALVVSMGMVLVGMFLSFARLVLGPTLPDRVVALDLLGVLAVGVIAIYSIAVNQSILIDPAFILALVGFLSTVGFARYLERRGFDE